MAPGVLPRNARTGRLTNAIKSQRPDGRTTTPPRPRHARRRRRGNPPLSPAIVFVAVSLPTAHTGVNTDCAVNWAGGRGGIQDKQNCVGRVILFMLNRRPVKVAYMQPSYFKHFFVTVVTYVWYSGMIRA